MANADQINATMNVLEERFGDDHTTFRQLRRFFDGMIWKDEEQMSRSLISVFRDLRHGDPSVGEPDVKVTLPLIESIVTKFASLLAPVPQVNVVTPPEGYRGLKSEEKRRALADQNEKFIYGLWEQNKVRRHFSKQGYYLPLMGSCFQGVHPDFDNKTMKFLTRSPEYAYPVWDAEFETILELGFKWQIPADVAVRTYGEQVRPYLQQTTKKFGFVTTKQAQSLEVIEYWDDTSKTTLVAGHQVQQVDHNLGFVPWVMTPFYLVPEESFGRGVIAGNVPLFQKMNMLDSLWLQNIIENTFPIMVVENPAGVPADIEKGPGAVVPVNAGGDVRYVSPAPDPTNLSGAMGMSMDYLQRGTHMPGSMFGEGVATSITTGKAQHESLMPTGNVVDSVQGNISDSWVTLNEYAMSMTEALFPSRTVVYVGSQIKKGSVYKSKQPFVAEIKGTDLQGWSKQQFSFEPLLNEHEKIVMNLQLAGGGLVSKRHIQSEIGITDPNEMQEEILHEALQDMQLQAMIAMVTSGQMTPEQVEASGQAIQNGDWPNLAPPPPPPMPGMPPGMPMPPTPPPGEGAAPGGPGGSMLPPALNPGQPPQGGPDENSLPTPSGANEFTLQGAIGDFSRIKKLKGDVWLIGEIVQKGGTDGPVEVALMDKLDKSTVINGLPDEYHGNLSFRVVNEVPSEPHVQVGPGHKGEMAGGPVVDSPSKVTADTGGVEPGPGFSPDAALPSFQPPLASNLPAGGFSGIRS